MGIIVGITGASGSIYGVSLIRVLADLGLEVHGIATEMGEKVMEFECGVTKADLAPYVTWHDNRDLFAPVASGSFPVRSMVVAPCSMNTLGALAAGMGDTLLSRAAGVTMKEGRKLVVVPREMPYSVLHLENMLRLARAGATILPASPGFYHKPENMAQLIGHVVGKILDSLAIDHNLYPRWGVPRPGK